jgi:hypothetical protein
MELHSLFFLGGGELTTTYASLRTIFEDMHILYIPVCTKLSFKKIFNI